MVFPSSASSFFQDTVRVRLGRKSSMTVNALEIRACLKIHGYVPVGMISASRSLCFVSTCDLKAALDTHAACTV